MCDKLPEKTGKFGGVVLAIGIDDGDGDHPGVRERDSKPFEQGLSFAAIPGKGDNLDGQVTKRRYGAIGASVIDDDDVSDPSHKGLDDRAHPVSRVETRHESHQGAVHLGKVRSVRHDGSFAVAQNARHGCKGQSIAPTACGQVGSYR